MMLNGARYAGFTITRGVRQGCPLSPLLFAVASDLLLRRLNDLIPEAVARAFADDLALVHSHIMNKVQLLQDIFEEYHKLSGLELNIKKTVLVPLFPYTSSAVRAQLHESAPLWGQIGIENTAKYLGLYVGPGSSSLSWLAPMRKYLDRAKVWGAAGLGMCNNLDAYSVFIVSVITFVGQLIELPAEFQATEDKAIQLLFPGPRHWRNGDILKP